MDVIPLPKGKKERLRLARAQAAGREIYIPARRIAAKSKVRITRELASVKMRSFIPCESSIEYDYYTVLDVDPDVVAFHAQPECLEFRDSSGTWRTHYPDVKVTFRFGVVEYHEVKQDKEADQPAVKTLHACIAETYAQRGHDYVVVRESAIRAEPRLHNAKLLRHNRQRRVTRGVAAQVFGLLTEGPLTMGELVATLGHGPDSGADILSMVARGELGIDWRTVQLGLRSLVWLAVEDLS